MIWTDHIHTWDLHNAINMVTQNNHLARKAPLIQYLTKAIMTWMTANQTKDRDNYKRKAM